MLEKGIILIATGAPGYGKLAYNMAMSIKSIESMPIAVIQEGAALSHLTDKQKEIFDFVIDLPADFKNGFGTKLHLDQLTPFEKTLYLDVDMLWIGEKPTVFFDRYKGNEFLIIHEGNTEAFNPKYYFWADSEEIKTAYKVSHVYQTRSEVIYFEKTKVFKKARELKPEKKLKTIRMFGTHIPDELYFNIAIAQLELELKPFNPAYWARLNREVMPPLSTLNKTYYLLSFGSNTASPAMKKIYDNVMIVAANKLRLPYLFKLQSKKEWAPGRLKI